MTTLPLFGEGLNIPARPLPRTIKPYPDEVLTSYLRRLAQANRLDPESLRVLLAGRRSRLAAIPADRLAVVSGQPEKSLRHAILELNTPARLAEMNVTGRAKPRGASRRTACHLCARARGIQQPVDYWARMEDVVCHRHRRWIGDGHAGRGRPAQPDLTDQPDILKANVHHRNMVRRRGRAVVAAAYVDARHVIAHWHLQWNAHANGFYRRMKVFLGMDDWRLDSDESTIHAATYPQIVELAGIFASPYWVSQALGDEHALQRFVNEVRRKVAPNYRLGGRSDPLLKWVEEELERRQGYRPGRRWSVTIANNEIVTHVQ